MPSDAPIATQADQRLRFSSLDTLNVKRFEPKDPRFDDTLEFDIRAFRNSYNFVASLREDENKELKKQIKKAQPGAEKEALITRLNNNKRRITQQKQFRSKAELRGQLRQKELEAVQQGKQRYFMKEKDIDKAIRGQLFLQKTGRQKKRLIRRRYEKN